MNHSAYRHVLHHCKPSVTFWSLSRTTSYTPHRNISNQSFSGALSENASNGEEIASYANGALRSVLLYLSGIRLCGTDNLKLKNH